MRQHPTLFRAPMVRAILDGRKLQTRRVISAHNSLVDGCAVGHRGAKFYGRPASIFWSGLDWSGAWQDPGPSPAGNPGPYLHVPFPAEGTVHRIYPQWQPHDLLWVRETFAHDGAVTVYRADCTDAELAEEQRLRRQFPGIAAEFPGGRWRPSIYMPRALSRLSLRVTGVRVERLQEISCADSIAEGLSFVSGGTPYGIPGIAATWHEDPRVCYRALWESINGAGAWLRNPHVWILDFVRIHRPEPSA